MVEKMSNEFLTWVNNYPNQSEGILIYFVNILFFLGVYLMNSAKTQIWYDFRFKDNLNKRGDKLCV